MNPYNLTLDKAPCSWNQSQVFKATGLVALPFRGNRFVQGWQLSGIVTANSGLPLTITDGYDEATGGSNYALPTRPDYVSGCQVYVKQVTEWYNPQCFTISAPGTFGDLGSDTLIGPRFVDFDFAVLKDTTLRENLRLQFRAEFFNILNHTNLALPNASLFVGGGSDPGGVLANYGNGGASGRSALAGQITNMFGTPRVIQFAMKLVF